VSSELAGSTRSADEYVGMLVVDVCRFSKHNNAQQQTIVEMLPEILRMVTERTDLASLWEQHQFRAFRGDGYIVGFARELVGLVVDRFFDALQGELRRRSGEFRAAGVELRVRTSLHLGPVASFDSLLTDSPSGRVMVDANRMVDAAAVRALLDNSDPEVTFVASVLSHSVMENVVEAGATTRRASEFVEAPLDVTAKEYSGRGYVRVPAPSGDLLRYGLLCRQPEKISVDEDPVEARSEGVESHVANHVSGSAHNAIQTGDVRGGIHYDSARDNAKNIAVTGHNNITAGGNVDQSSGKQEFSGRFRAGHDANFGPSSGRRIGGDIDPKAR
jgi:hypothetical protein